MHDEALINSLILQLLYYSLSQNVIGIISFIKEGLTAKSLIYRCSKCILLYYSLLFLHIIAR